MPLPTSLASLLLDQYLWSIWALLLIAATASLQHLVAMVAHRKQSQYIPGIVSEELGHDSFVFRSNRTFLNTLENLPLMVGPAVIALLVGMDAQWLAGLLWVFAIARIVHMALYYAIATEANPSPRSHFFAIGLLSNLTLLVMLALHIAG